VIHDAAEDKHCKTNKLLLERENIMANVQILGLAHAMFNGVRGEAGGAPSKDSIFGIALVQGNLISFGGRRGGTLRFKTYKKTERDAQTARFTKKLSGNPFGKNIDAHYTQVNDAVVMAELVGADFEAKLATAYYKAMANKKLNTYSRVPKAAKQAVVAE
jgi:hypothetical protein